jgi:CheY-like chemotaxis protein
MTGFDSDPGISPLRGLRILVVEDEMMIAMLMEDFLGEFGCTVVGPAASIAKAMPLIATAAIDGAMLDMNLAGKAVYPVADELARRGIPFIFVTGYGDRELRGDHNGRPRLPKPFRRQELQQTMTRVFAATSEQNKMK